MKNKVVIITGASSGIGLAMCHEFASRGANIVLAARNYVACCQIAEDVRKKYNVEALAVATDVAVEDSCKNLIAETLKKFNKIDILINNAGISMRAVFEELDLAVLKQVMDINFWGTVYCTKYALPYLLEAKGSVVGISSIAGYKGLPLRSGYSASKFAMNGFLESIRIENMYKGLHVLTAAPGFTNSNIRNTALSLDGSAQGESPLKENELMSAEAVATHIANAILARKNTLILTFQGKLSVFLNKFIPNFVNKRVYDVFASEPNSPLKKQ